MSTQAVPMGIYVITSSILSLIYASTEISKRKKIDNTAIAILSVWNIVSIIVASGISLIVFEFAKNQFNPLHTGIVFILVIITLVISCLFIWVF